MFDFDNIYEAKSIKDAIVYLSKKPDTWIIAGGTDTVINLREGDFSNRSLLSINGIKELEGISLDAENNIHIKPNTTFRQIVDNPIIQDRIPYFIEASETIGSPQIRNIATIGGNISNGFTTADAPPTLFVLDTHVIVTGTGGNREMPIQEYYVASEVMNLKSDELLTDIIIPYEGHMDYTCHYIKYAIRKSLDIVLLGCAVACKVSDDKKTLEDIKISLGAAAPIPIRALNTENELRGMIISEQLFDVIDQHIESDVSLRSDMRASREFRLHLCKVLTKRALMKTLSDHGIKENF